MSFLNENIVGKWIISLYFIKFRSKSACRLDTTGLNTIYLSNIAWGPLLNMLITAAGCVSWLNISNIGALYFISFDIRDMAFR